MRKLRLLRPAGLPPVPLLVVRRLPGRLIGFSGGLFVIVRHDFRDDWPTLVHEIEHCRQFWRGGLLLHFLRYVFERRYRLRCELQAYGAELRSCPPAERRLRLDDAARALATGYALGIDTAVCRRMLVEHVDRNAQRVSLADALR